MGGLGPTLGHEIVVIRPPVGAAALLCSGSPEPSGEADGAAGRRLPFDVAGAEVFRVSLQELQSGNPERNILLQAGRHGLRAEGRPGLCHGQRGPAGTYRYQEGMTVLQVLTLAGGVTERGSQGG